MIAFLHDRFLPEEQALVSVLDRGFLYGDGLFETVRAYHGRLFCWSQHYIRLAAGAGFLRIPLPMGESELGARALELLARNETGEALLRITLTRGVGVRGYSTRGAERPSLAMTVHPAPTPGPEGPAKWRLATTSVHLLAGDPLARYKTCNKLPQIRAKAEAELLGADEGLLLGQDGSILESSGANLFWIEDGRVRTTPLESGVLAGVTRQVVQALCRDLGLPFDEAVPQGATLLAAEGVFLTTSGFEVVEAVSLDGQALRLSRITTTLRRAYHEKVERECA